MASTTFSLRGIRDFSSNINDTFLFIKQEVKPFFKGLLMIVGPFFLLSAILIGIGYGRLMGLALSSSANTSRINESELFPMTSTLIFYVLVIVCQAALTTYVAAYFKAYEDNRNQSPSFAQIWTVFGKNFLRILLYSLLFLILIGIGVIFCIVPGIYLSVLLAPFGFIMVQEEQYSLSYVWERCTDLLRGVFWPTLGLYIVVYFISSSVGSIVGLLFGGLSGLISYFTTKDISSTIGIGYGIVIVFAYLFTSILSISIGLHYFSRVESVDSVGLLQKIDQLGAGENDDENNII
ncbi:MAG: hypothetical protein QM727_15635 [Niabella sp.]